MATAYDELRTDVKESQENSLEALKTAKAPDANSVVEELDEVDTSDGLTPGGEFIADELVVQVIPRPEDEFTCYSCFLVRHRSQRAREKDGHAYCVECEGCTPILAGCPGAHLGHHPRGVHTAYGGRAGGSLPGAE